MLPADLCILYLTPRRQKLLDLSRLHKPCEALSFSNCKSITKISQLVVAAAFVIEFRVGPLAKFFNPTSLQHSLNRSVQCPRPHTDLAFRALTGGHLFGGTEYMWDPRFSLPLRLLSLFHLVWPALLWWALRRVGYDRRALLAQALLALVVLVVSRVVQPDANINFARADPFTHRSWGPAPVHVGLTALALVGLVYAPTHALLRRVMPRR